MKWNMAKIFIQNGLVIICAIAIAQLGTDYRIGNVCLSVCLSVCARLYGRIFRSILMKRCTVVWHRKTKIEFVRRHNLMMRSSVYFFNFHPCNAWDGKVQTPQ